MRAWQLSWIFGRGRQNGGEMGGSDVSTIPGFFVSNTRRLFGNFAMANFYDIWPWHVNRGWNADFGHKFMKSFHSGVICPQNPKLGGGQTGTSLRAAYMWMHCRDILFTPCCSPMAREFPRSCQLFVWRTVAELRASKLPNFRILAYFPPYKTPKKYLPLTSLQPRGYIAEWSHTRTVVRECCKGDEASQWRKPKFDPPPRPNPVSDRNTNRHTWLRHGPLRLCKS